MNILPLMTQDEKKFDELAHAGGTIFNTSAWASVFGEKLCRYGIYNGGGELIGGFILYREKIFGMSFYRNPPFTPAIGPFLKIDATNPAAVMDVWKKVLKSMSEFLDRLPYAVMSLSLNYTVTDSQPFYWRKFKVIPAFTYLLDLSASVEQIWKNMSGERRKNITKAVKDGLTAGLEGNPDIVRDLVKKTFLRQRKRADERHLDRILCDFAGSGNSFAYVTRRDGIPVSCAFCVHGSKTAHYLLGGYDADKKHHGAGSLALWEAIRHSRDLGLLFFDLEGSMVPQIETYFRGFGGKLTPYYTVNKAKLPLEVILKMFKRELF